MVDQKTLTVVGIVIVLIIIGLGVWWWYRRSSNGGGNGGNIIPSAPQTIMLQQGDSDTDWELTWTASATGSAPITYTWQIATDALMQNVIDSGSTEGTSAALSSKVIDWSTYYAEVTASNPYGQASSGAVQVQTQGVPKITATSWSYNPNLGVLSAWGTANTTLTAVVSASVTQTPPGGSPTTTSTSNTDVSEPTGILNELANTLATSAQGSLYVIVSTGGCDSSSTLQTNLQNGTLLSNVYVYVNGTNAVFVQDTTGARYTVGGVPVTFTSVDDLMDSSFQYSLGWAALQTGGGCVYTGQQQFGNWTVDAAPSYTIISNVYCPTTASPQVDCSALTNTFIAFWDIGSSVAAGTSFSFTVVVSGALGDSAPTTFGGTIAGVAPSAPSNIMITV